MIALANLFRRAPKGVLAVAALVLTIFCTTDDARAQMGGMGALMRPMVDSKEVDALVQLLKLDADTETAVRDLFVAFQSQHAVASEKLQEIFQKAQEEAQRNNDMSVIQDMQKKALEFYKSQLTARDRLFDDIKLMLTPEQLEKWPDFERLHRRTHLLDSGQNLVAGSTVDLVQLVDDTRPKSSEANAPEVDDMLNRYAADLDRILIESRDLQAEQLEQTQKMLAEGGNFMANLEQWSKMFNDARALQVKVRELNARYERQIAGLLSDDQRAEFSTEYNRRANPRVYARNYVDGAFDTALGLESLTTGQREQVIAIQAEYRNAAQPICEKWDAALADWQSRVQMMEMFSPGAGSAEAKEFEQAKKDLDEQTYSRLRGILTAEQASALPERETSNWRTEPTFDGN